MQSLMQAPLHMLNAGYSEGPHCTSEEAQEREGLCLPGMATIGYVSSAKEKADPILGKRSLLSANRKPTSAIRMHAQADCAATTGL